MPDAAGGRYVITGLSASAQADLVKSLALTPSTPTAPAGAKAERPRIGLLLGNTSMDEGWTRWVLDQYEFEYSRISGADIQAGSLRDKIDVLVPRRRRARDRDGRRTRRPGRGRGGRGRGAFGRARRGQEAPPDLTADNDARVRAIDEFVRAGGTLVCFNRSSTFAIDQLKLPVKNVVAGLSRQQFFVGGSLLTVVTDPAHRVMAGMPERAAVFYDSGPVFETREGFKGTVLARYPDEGARRSRPASCRARRSFKARPPRSTSSSATATSSCSASARSGAVSRSARSVIFNAQTATP